MATAQTTLNFVSKGPSVENCCLNCNNLSKTKYMNYCEYYQAFLEPETLTINCDFFDKPKKQGVTKF